ncbi:beta-scruin-like [Dendronephthya gigantea]|uniref:beta-scruin-like n=1 Tax=Dendronephthya gigantea TaxID=151771 RepID=UPI00106B132B|nr:beta-scruin-like [Dendronephthya gigantea]
MAYCLTEVKYGYDDSRFETGVDDHFHCSICYNVLKEPRSCRNNEHMFCLDCITEHLNVNSQTCPECNEDLSVDTLRRPRVLNNYLSKLKINCDHASRGCPEFVCVEDLTTHVGNCGFAPVSCSNENCGAKINKKDKVRHETVECEYRTVKCHDCGQIREDMLDMRGSLVELDQKVETGMSTVVGNMKGSFVELDQKLEASNTETRNSLDQITWDHQEIKKEVQDVKEDLDKVKKDMNEMKDMMSQILEKLDILELPKKPAPSPAEGVVLDTPRQDILIAGGFGSTQETGKSTEIYFWEKNGWFEASAMNEDHIRASSFIYYDQLFIVGGENGSTIETMDLNELPLKWKKFPGKLPYDCADHQTVVYKRRIFYIGGYDRDEKKCLSVISESSIISPCCIKKLCKMPQPRQCHRAELVEDKLQIFGGENDSVGAFDSVLEYDPKKNKCGKKPPLHRPLTKMATVPWRDQVVVIGGCDEKG